MDKKSLERNIKKNYKAVQNYLNGDPGAEGFLNSLADLQADFADYLIEILKTKKYGKDDVKKSNIYQGHIKGGEDKYINNDKLENIVAEKVLGKKVSINSLLDEGIKKLEKLFDTQKSLEKALESGELQSIKLDNVILPSDDLPAPTIGNGEGVENKNLSQNKFWLFVSTLRELGIYDDDLIIYSGKVENNMMRKNSYYAIFIPRINKTVFLNTGYSEATFVCEGEVSIDKMTTLGKEKLQNELGAIRIKFFESNINLWKTELSNALLGKGGKVGEKIEIKKIRDRINKRVELDKLKDFYIKHKDDTFIDSDGKKSTIKNLFSKLSYYKTNYKIVNEQLSPEVNFPGNPSNYYNIRWNEFLIKLGIEVNEYEIMSLDDLKIFYSEHRDDTFKDSSGKISTVKRLFSNLKYYLKNYKELNKNLDIKLPGNPTNYYNNISRGEIQQELGIESDERGIISLDDLKIFVKNNQDRIFYKNIPIKTLFSSLDSYLKYYKEFNKNTNFDFRLPGDHVRYYNKHKKNSKINRKEFQEELGIEVDTRKIISLDNLRNFYFKYKHNSTVKKLFSSGLDFYKNNYKKINNNPKSFDNIRLPGNPLNCYGNKLKRKITRYDFLGIIESEIDTRKIISLEDIKGLINNKSEIFVNGNGKKTEFFIDCDGNKSTVGKLFSGREYYKKNFGIANKVSTLDVKFSANPKQYYKIGWKKIKAFLGT